MSMSRVIRFAITIDFEDHDIPRVNFLKVLGDPDRTQREINEAFMVMVKVLPHLAQYATMVGKLDEHLAKSWPYVRSLETLENGLLRLRFSGSMFHDDVDEFKMFSCWDETNTLRPNVLTYVRNQKEQVIVHDRKNALALPVALFDFFLFSESGFRRGPGTRKAALWGNPLWSKTTDEIKVYVNALEVLEVTKW